MKRVAAGGKTDEPGSAGGRSVTASVVAAFFQTEGERVRGIYEKTKLWKVV